MDDLTTATLLRQISDLSRRLAKLEVLEHPKITPSGSGGALFIDAIDVGSATGAATGDMLASGRIETAHGTWTPTFKGSGTAGVFTYTQQVGNYIKIGKLVYIQGRVAISAIGTPPTGNMTIEGLPFASEATNFHSIYFGTISHLIYSGTAKQIMARVLPSGTTITLLESISNASAPAVLAANFTDVACDLIFSGWYAVP